MAVVALVRDVLADVVQQRRVLEHLAVVVVEPVQLAQLVEELEREHRRRGASAPRGHEQRRASAMHRRPPHRERVVGPVVGIVAADRVEHDALAQRPVAHGELVDLEQLHRDGS